MFFYIVILFLLLTGSTFEIASNNKKFSIITFSFFTFFFYILSFIRWETGTDWDTYYKMYTWIKEPWENIFHTGMEPGFAFINNLGKFLFDDYTGVLFLFSTILYIYMSKSYLILSQYPLTSLFISFCVLSFAHILYVRQNVALVLLFWSVYYIKNRQIKSFLLCVFVASLFHRTAWIFLLAYPVFHKNYSFKFYLIAIIASLTIGTIVGKIILGFIGNMGLGIISEKITGYMELGAKDNSTTLSTTSILIKGFINRGVILTLIFYCKYKLKYRDSFFNGLVNIYILGTILYFITLPLSISLARIAVYMDSIQAVLIPYIIYNQKYLYNRILFFTIIALYYSARFYTSFISFEYEYVPFKTIFNT